MCWPRSSFRLLTALAFAVLTASFFAQTLPIEGQISAFQPPATYEVEGLRFVVISRTSFGSKERGKVSVTSPLRNNLHVDVHVQVAIDDPGRTLPSIVPIVASTVLIRNDLSTKLSSTGVITGVV